MYKNLLRRKVVRTIFFLRPNNRSTNRRKHTLVYTQTHKHTQTHTRIYTSTVHVLDGYCRIANPKRTTRGEKVLRLTLWGSFLQYSCSVLCQRRYVRIYLYTLYIYILFTLTFMSRHRFYRHFKSIMLNDTSWSYSPTGALKRILGDSV